MTRRKAQRDKVLRSIFLIFRLFSAVTRTCLHTFGNACGIERAADNVITNAGQILDTSAPDKNGRVFLQVVTFAGNVYGTFLLVGKAHSCNLSYSRVRFFGRSCRNRKAYAALLRAVVQNGRLALVNLLFSAVSDKLIDSGHCFTSLIFSEYITFTAYP